MSNLRGSSVLKDADIFCGSETWATNQVKIGDLSEFTTVSTAATRDFSSGRASGGLLSAGKKVLSTFRLLDESHCWQFLECEIDDFSLILGNVYFKPSEDLELILESFETVLLDLRERFRDSTFLIGGDFNSWIGELDTFPEGSLAHTNLSDTRCAIIPAFNSRGTLLTNFMNLHGFLVLNGRSPSDTPANITFCGQAGCSTVDLIWVDLNNAHRICDLKVIHQPTLSDHFPVSVTLQLNSYRDLTSNLSDINPSGFDRLIWQDSLESNFTELMRWSPNVEKCTVNITSEEMYSNLISTIKSSAEKCGMLKTFYRKEKTDFKKPLWFDAACAAAKRNLNTALRICQNNNFETNDRINWIQRKKEFRILTENKRKKWENDIVEAFANVRNNTDFWNTYKQFTRKKTIFEMPTLDAWNSFLETVFPPRTLFNTQFTGVIDPYLDSEISLSEVLDVLHKCKRKKAPGEDLVSNDFLKALPDNWCIYLTLLFQKIFDTECVPSSFSNVTVTMIYKKGDRLNPANYRSIALVNASAKEFTQVICNRLTQWTIRSNLFSPYQSGFIAGRSCLDNIFVLNTLTQLKVKQVGGKVYSVMVDFKRAFDSVPHDLLWLHLFKMGVSAKILRILSAFYSNAKMTANIKGNKTDTFEITEGVLQGEILSPLLFILYISDIDEFFRSKGHDGIRLNNELDVIVLLYADDLIIFAHSPLDLKRKLATLEEYCLVKGLCVNESKTKVMIFKKGGRLRASEKNFMYKNNSLEIVNTFDYLGTTLSSSTLGLTSTNSAICKAKKALGALLSTLNNAKVDSWQTRIKLLDSTVFSVLLYGAPLWGLRYINELEIIQTDFYKKLLCLPRNTPHCIVRLECGATRIAYKLLQLAWRWVIRVLEMTDDRLPKICYLRLLSASSYSPNSKYNWVCQLKDILVTVDYSWILKETDPFVWKIHEPQFLNRYGNFLRAQDYEEALRCRAMQIRFEYTLNSPFINFRCPPYFCKVMAQLRMATTYVCKITVKGFSYSICSKENCSICNLHEPESLTHIFFDCPHYLPLRTHFIKPLLNNQLIVNKQASLQFILDCSSFRKIRNVYFFVVNSLRIRAFLRNE